MTRNNLRDQLTWLLANVGQTAPDAPVPPPARDHPDRNPSSDTPLSQATLAGARPETRVNPIPASSLYPVLPSPASLPPQWTNGPTKSPARPSEPPERAGGTGPAEERMGRPLPKSGSRRPGLVMREEQLPTPTSTGAATGSLTKEYDALLKNSNAAGVANSAKKRASAQRQVPTPASAIRSENTLDVLDLTGGDDELTSPNSAAFTSNGSAAHTGLASTTEDTTEFGTDVMVWQEDYAMRPEPVPVSENSEAFGSDVMVWEEEHAMRPEPLTPKRGQKRKSDQISQPPPMPTVLDDFPDIYELLSDDDFLPSRTRRSPTKSPAKAKLKTGSDPTSSRPVASTKKAADHKPTHEAGASASSSHPPDRVVRSSPIRPRRRDKPLHEVMSTVEEERIVPRSEYDSAPEKEPETPKTRVARPRATKSDDRIIGDSDDELPTPTAPASTAHSGDRPRLSTRRAADMDFVIAYETPSKPKPKSKSVRNTPLRSPRKPEPSASFRTETAGGSDPDPGAELSQDSEAFTQTNPIIDDDEKNAILELFLARPSVIERKREVLRGKMQQNKDAYKQSLKNGDLEPRGRLKREKERLTKQQAALDALSNEYRSYEEVQVKKDALISRISDAYDQDLDTQDDESRLEELEGLLKERQLSLRNSLVKAGVDDRNLFKAADHYSYPIVQATQPTKPTPSTSLSRDPALVPQGSTQIILQTQLPEHSDYESKPRHGRDEAPPMPLQSSMGRPRRQAVSPLPEIEEMVDDRPSFASASSKLARTPARQKSTVTTVIADEDLYAFDDDDELLEDLFPSTSHRAPDTTTTYPQPTSTVARKSPAKAKPSRGQVYHSDYSDDVDMAQAAKEFDLQQSLSATRVPPPHRPVLSETSGNAGARPQKSAATKVADPLVTTHIPRELKNRPWFKDVKRALKDRFRMSGFRHNQLEAIDATLSGKDAFVLMPTGGGKSLCYQLPAVVSSGETHGVTVVVSPLISLMQDQVEHLRALNIQAASFSGEVKAAERSEIMRQLQERYPEQWLQLLYVTPEMINKSKAFLNGLNALYQNRKLARLVIDEAHCVSQWGHDFRPDYKELGSFRRRFPGVPLMALTATATQNVILDVKHNLGIEECKEFSQSFNRPNLYYAVMRKEKDNTVSIANLINTKYKGKTGIVYTLARKSAENIAKKLRDHGIAAHHYHASIEPEEKTRIQKEWQAGRIKVVVATIAFGMGIDKPDVRFVIHQSIPKSLEGYYQETGRAGRDGKPSECYLYFNYGDVMSLRKMISDGDGSEEQRERQRNMLSTVAAFCDNQSDCRRVEILRYFGESFKKEDCGATCDNCRNNDVFEQRDFTEYAVAAIGLVRSQGKLTLNQCADYLMGKRKLPDGKPGAEQFYGVARQLPKHEVQRIVDRLVSEDALKEENVFNRKTKMAIQYFRVGSGARAFSSKQHRLFLSTRVKGKDSQASGSKTQARTAKATATSSRNAASSNVPSTNVSSPVLRKQRTGKGKAVATSDGEDSDDAQARHPSGYAHDGFVVADEESDDDFETMPARRSKSRSEPKPIGPPISRDVRMKDAELSGLHDDVVCSFLEEAKDAEEELRNSKNLRQPIFSEQQLREMAIRWTVSLEQMRQIPGINTDKVDRYGSALLPLVRSYRAHYQEMTDAASPRRAGEASGSRDTVDLVSTDDDDEGMPDLDLDLDLDEDEEAEAAAAARGAERSSYFPAPAKRAERRGPPTSRARSNSSAPRASSKATWSGAKRAFSARKGASSSGGEGGGGGGGGGSAKGKPYGGVRKKGAAGYRRAAGAASASFGQQGRGGGGASAGDGAGGRAARARPHGVGFTGIGLMEH
ncbi:hypothetical protein GGS23DRAFT_611322 [Durotheca rogersii]|uniref:uncharacterized protein n=1 Tax=Durotheca rogersii TaxID=419775 RepID=UPI00221F3472|nr:uncharacterized protein GGS23DRAFT_611322 [Durotheca rogersii]KAI5861716.1 hypothetical protein GGS23DRAFT_611322 [Durotheca rogersii]